MRKYLNKIFIYIDAACKKNLRKAMVAVVIKDEANNLLEKFCVEVKNKTSNQAEYLAALKGLESALKHCRNEINVFSDSELLVKQLNGKYRIRSKSLLGIIKQIKVLELLFKKVKYKHIKKSKNREAHKLAKRFL